MDTQLMVTLVSQAAARGPRFQICSQLPTYKMPTALDESRASAGRPIPPHKASDK
jgi:hypothetical protein